MLERNILFDNTKTVKHSISMKELKIYMLAFFMFISLLPWFVWNTYTTVLLVVFVLYLFLSLKKFKILNKASLLILLILLHFSIIRINQDFNSWVFINISIITMFLIANENQEIKKSSFEMFIKIFSLFLIPGIIIFLITNFYSIPSLGLMKGRSIIADNYENYFFYIKNNQPYFNIFPRFNSIFDEAGVLGNVCIFILFFLEFKIKKWYSIVVLIAGILSFSLFFYLSFMILFSIRKINKIKHLIIIFSLVALFYGILRENEILKTYLYDRIEVKDNHSIAGDNRTTGLWDSFYLNFQKTNSKYFGVLGLEKNRSNEFEWVASYQMFIYQYGFIGLILIFMYYFFTLKKGIKFYTATYIMLLFIIAIYQRPYILEYNYYSLIFFCGTAYLTENTNVNKQKLNEFVNE